MTLNIGSFNCISKVNIWMKFEIFELRSLKFFAEILHYFLVASNFKLLDCFAAHWVVTHWGVEHSNDVSIRLEMRSLVFLKLLITENLVSE